MLIDIHTHLKENEAFSLYNAFLERTELACSYGIHPWYVEKEVDVLLTELEAIVNLENCYAIGECGLDKNTDTPWGIQLEIFRKQIELAEKHQKPLIIHCVKAIQELILLKREYKSSQTWVVHGFRKTNTLNQLLQEGFYISLGKALLYDEKLQQILPDIPLNRLFFETDDQEFEIKELYLKASEILNLEFSVLEKQIENNFKEVFQKERLF